MRARLSELGCRLNRGETTVKNGPDALEMGCLFMPLMGDVIVCYGRAKLTDKHLASKIHCVDDEVIGWLERREQHRRDRHGSGSLSSDGIGFSYSGSALAKRRAMVRLKGGLPRT
jgi:hypothetical protein